MLNNCVYIYNFFFYILKEMSQEPLLIKVRITFVLIKYWLAGVIINIFGIWHTHDQMTTFTQQGVDKLCKRDKIYVLSFTKNIFFLS